VVKVDQIQWIETADNYVILHTADGEPLMRQTLAGLLEKLGPRFIRCHRRAAVQLSWIASIANLEKATANRPQRRPRPLSQFRSDLETRLTAGTASQP
jgi:two-component system LytT family response regulator